MFPVADWFTAEMQLIQHVTTKCEPPNMYYSNLNTLRVNKKEDRKCLQ